MPSNQRDYVCLCAEMNGFTTLELAELNKQSNVSTRLDGQCRLVAFPHTSRRRLALVASLVTAAAALFNLGARLDTSPSAAVR